MSSQPSFCIQKTERHNVMEICVESLDGVKYTVEVGVDDTTADIRRKVASAAGLCEDGFDMSFGGEVMIEGDYITQLSAGDTVVLKTKSQKHDAIAALRDLGETRWLTAERFQELENLKLIHLFLQAEVVTEIPYKFLSGGTFEELDLSGASAVTRTNDRFLYECRSVRAVDLSGWTSTWLIGASFLFSCNALTTLDLSGWNNVTHIGSSFLAHCTALTTLDLSGWRQVTHIGGYFLDNCSALQTVDLSGWHNVMHIGCHFVSSCSELRTLALPGWKNVVQINSHFVYNCGALTALDFSGWTSVMKIETGFLNGSTTHNCNINVTGSSSLVSAHVKHSPIGDVKPALTSRTSRYKDGDTKCQCVCM